MMSQLALVTGGSGTLGAEVARGLAAEGHRIALTGRNPQLLEENALPGVLTVPADLGKVTAVDQLFQTIEEHFGERPTLLAHCAGGVMIRPLHRTSAEQYRSCLQNNLDSAFFTLQGFVKGLLDQKSTGSAVLVSSVAARIGIANHAAIAAAKAGVEGLVRTVAATYAGHGIRINGVAPGLLRTRATEGFFVGSKAEEQIAAQYPLGRYGSAKDAAGLICWLLSGDAEWVTGQVIAVDGGFSATRPLAKRQVIGRPV